MRKELVISLNDIESLCIECSNQRCKSQIRVTLKAEVYVEDIGNLVPLAYCPVCRAEFGDGMRRAIDNLRGAIKALVGRTPVVSFQVNCDALPSK